MQLPIDRRYASTHEWALVQGGEVLVGITDFAQHELGDIVFIEIETVGEELGHGEVFGTVEAVKTVSDLFMPVSGTVKEKNEELDTTAELVNSDPYGKGWMIRVELSDPSEIDALLDAEAYKKLIGA